MAAFEEATAHGVCLLLLLRQAELLKIAFQYHRLVSPGVLFGPVFAAWSVISLRAGIHAVVVVAEFVQEDVTELVGAGSVWCPVNDVRLATLVLDTHTNPVQ